jgi:phosphoglycerate dehydrogenase-like enzyme
MRLKVLISAPYMIPVMDRFGPMLNDEGIDYIIAEVNERLEEDQLLSYIGEIDGVICGDDRFTPKVLQNAPKLRVISKWGTGIDSIDQEACAKLGIRICRTTNAFSEPVADSVYGYILSFARRLPWMDRAMKSGEWKKIPGRALNESVLGIIGVGDCGKAVARRAKGFGLTLLGNDLLEMPEDFVAETGIEMVEKDEVFKRADFISVNTDLNPTSFHLISTDQLARMQPNAILINAARGPLVDEPALVAALQNKQIAGVALDVFEDEPLPENSPLKSMDNVMLAPHNANSSPMAWENVHQSTFRNLLQGLKEVER